jgi:ParE toxin of type II toxin-antitoxin system, parDE
MICISCKAASALSTQDAHIIYVRKWIVPRWGGLPLEQVKTVEVERWLRATGVTDGTKAKIKCVMSALFSHAVRWEFCGHNPITSGIPVGTGGKRGPSTGMRISAKRQKSPLVLSPEQVQLGLAELEFRDQLLVFLKCEVVRDVELHILSRRGLGYTPGRTRGAPLAGVRLRQHQHQHPTLVLLVSRWRPQKHKTEASAQLLPMHPGLKHSLQEWRSQSLYNKPEDFVFPHAHSFRVASLCGIGRRRRESLQGREELRLRIGDYRLFFVCADPDTIEIRRVRHRSEAYR